MPSPQPLASRFLVGHADVPVDEAALDAALARAAASARATWAGVVWSDEAFAEALGRLWDGAGDPIAWLDRVRAADVFLSRACVARDAAALAALERGLLAPLGRELAASPALGAFASEAVQGLWVRLLVAEGGAEPRLATYRGEGALVAWLRLALTRVAINLREARHRDTPFDDERAPAASDPELDLLRRTYADELAAAMKGALAAASPEDRGLLRMHFLDGLSATEIGGLFQVSGRTIQRRIAQARAQIVERTRAALRARFGGNVSLLETLFRLVGDDLQVSLRAVLQGDPDRG
jgi:RNA polymerase sigma-70 factor (ECF subfamily)